MRRLSCILSLLCLLCLSPLSFAAASERASHTASTAVINLSEDFDGLRGTAVFYAPQTDRFLVHGKELAEKRSSPCSTFKIFSTWTGLLTGAIDPDHSVRRWNGTAYWLDAWNKDMDLQNAFNCSCVWYYRRVIDDIGRSAMQAQIDRYAYGNRDISDWNGALTPGNDPAELKGFWLESSLRISPKEQTEVLARLFADRSIPEKRRAAALLKKLMAVPAASSDDLSIYGKTGFGTVDGQNTDAWFVGWYEAGRGPTYFAVRLDDPLNPNATSGNAKAIAVQIITRRAAHMEAALKG